jgi:anti-sigma factor RsiW
MKERPTIDQALGDLASSVEEGLAVHPDEHPFLAHKRGELSPQEADALEEHLAWCRPCAALWQEVSGLGAGEPEPIDPEEKRGDWESLQRRLAAGEEPVHAGEPRPAPEPAPRRRYSPAIAAVLALALGGAGVWIATLNTRLDDQRRPRPNVAVRDLKPPAAERQGAESGLEIDAGETTVLVLNPRTPVADDAYRAEILAEDGGRPVWTLDGLVPTLYGTFTVQLPPGSLAPGEYRLVLLSAEEAEPLETFHLRVVETGRAPGP